MPRYTFQLRIRAGAEPEYDWRHVAVWPELLLDPQAAGAVSYSISRRDQQLFLNLELDRTFGGFIDCMAVSEVNQRWQVMMTDIFDPVPGFLTDEPFAMMRAVFHLSGAAREKNPVEDVSR